MNIKDRIAYTHSALSINGFCGFEERGGWHLQFQGDLERGGVFSHIKRK